MASADRHNAEAHVTDKIILPSTVRSFESSVVIACTACEWFRWEAR